MSRYAYVNGRYLPHSQAAVHVEDRGFQFGDAIYEVWSVRRGQLLDAEGHLNRLQRSLSELSIPSPMGPTALMMVVREIMRRNRIKDGLVYLQVSRGVAKRDHAFPDPAPRPTVVLTAKRVDAASVEAKANAGASIISQPDLRWGRCDIKTVNLLPNVLAKQAARDAGAAEAWMVDADGFVTEGGSSNAWIVDQDGRLITRQLDNAILHGITRGCVADIARGLGYEVVERPFTLEEAHAAREAFMTSASTFVTAITRIDDKPIGNGAPGSVATELRNAYQTQQ
ncbi:MAG: D-amino-acid transaminase [Alphaproteobacteria bacterium]|nr:D-amino-acid transaminase [Alphaproteobacteria bacterium]